MHNLPNSCILTHSTALFHFSLVHNAPLIFAFRKTP
uniref:Uncharacterized protein n=1 Tax=Rhizophora mucronata TaxID=61149 RepID=A0A2P2QWH9_RHIMU